MKGIFQKYEITPTSPPYDILYDGKKYIWVACGTSLEVYTYWSYSETISLYESELPYEEVDSLTDIFKEDVGSKIIKVASFPVSLRQLTLSGTSVFGVNGTTIKSFDIDSLTENTGLIDNLPRTIWSNLFYAYDKLWAVCKYDPLIDEFEGDVLYSWDLKTNVEWTITARNFTRQTIGKRWITCDFNNNIYISSYSTGVIHKFSLEADFIIADYKIDIGLNKIDYDLISHKIIFSSNNKLGYFDLETLEITPIVNTEGNVFDFTYRTSDNCYWFVKNTGHIVKKGSDYKTKLKVGSTKSFGLTFAIPTYEKPVPPNLIGYTEDNRPIYSIITSPEEDPNLIGITEDNKDVYSIIASPEEDPEKIISRLIVIPEKTIIDHLGQEILINEYVCCIDASKFYIFKNKKNFYDLNYLSITGQAMIYSGTDHYIGEY